MLPRGRLETVSFPLYPWLQVLFEGSQFRMLLHALTAILVSQEIIQQFTYHWDGYQSRVSRPGLLSKSSNLWFDRLHNASPIADWRARVPFPKSQAWTPKFLNETVTQQLNSASPRIVRPKPMVLLVSVVATMVPVFFNKLLRQKAARQLKWINKTWNRTNPDQLSLRSLRPWASILE